MLAHPRQVHDGCGYAGQAHEGFDALAVQRGVEIARNHEGYVHQLAVDVAAVAEAAAFVERLAVIAGYDADLPAIGLAAFDALDQLADPAIGMADFLVVDRAGVAGVLW